MCLVILTVYFLFLTIYLFDQPRKGDSLGLFYVMRKVFLTFQKNKISDYMERKEGGSKGTGSCVSHGCACSDLPLILDKEKIMF